MGSEAIVNPLSYNGLLPEFSLLCGIFLICLLVFINPEKTRGTAFWITLAVLGMAFFWADGDPAARFPAGISADSSGFILKRYFCISAAAFLFCWLEWQQESGMKMSALFFVLLLVSCLSLMVLVQVNSLWMMLLAAEGFSFSAYALAAHLGNNGNSAKSVLRYFGTGALATAVSLFGLTWLSGFEGIPADGISGFQDSLVFFPLAGAVFFLAFLLFKTGCFPFHSWLPEVFQEAPVPVAGYLASAPKVAAAFACLRLVQELNLNLSVPMLLLALITGLYGNLSAFRSTDLKQMLAFSSIGMAAFLLIPAIFARQISGSGSQLLYFSLAYGTAVQAAFCACQYFGGMKSERLLLSDFAGMFRLNPNGSVGLTALLLAIIGIPPFAGFTGKLLVMSALPAANGLEGNNRAILLLLVAVLITVLSAGYFFRVMYQIYFKEAREDLSFQRPFQASFLLMWMGVIWQLFAFFFPEIILQASS